MATGSFRIDGSTVSDNATLFGGATIETEKASSRLQLSSGARIELAPRSRAKVYDDHLSLESGLGELASKEYQIEAKTLRIETDETNSLARVKIESPKSVLVTAVHGSVRVYNEIGMLVANVKPGMALAFQPQAAAPTASERTGCLMRSRDDPAKFILVDTVANVTVEVRGAGVAEQVGSQVKVTGTTFRSVVPVLGASQDHSGHQDRGAHRRRMRRDGCRRTNAERGANRRQNRYQQWSESRDRGSRRRRSGRWDYRRDPEQ